MDKTLFDKLKLIELENFLYTIFIISSLIDMSANEKLKDLYLKNKKPNQEIKNLYLLASYLSLIVFISFMERNYNNLMKEKTNSKEYHLLEIRYFGSVLLVLGQILVIYYLLNTESYNGSPI